MYTKHFTILEFYHEDFLKVIGKLRDNLEKNKIKTQLFNVNTFIEKGKEYLVYELQVDSSLEKEVTYVGSILHKSLEDSSKECVYTICSEKHKDLLIENSHNLNCDLCNINKQRNEMHLIIINGELKVIGSSCIIKYLPNQWYQKIKYFSGQFLGQIKDIDDFVYEKNNMVVNHECNKYELFCMTLHSISELSSNKYVQVLDMTRYYFTFIKNEQYHQEDKDKKEQFKALLQESLGKYHQYYDDFVKFIVNNKDDFDLDIVASVTKNEAKTTLLFGKYVYAIIKYNDATKVVSQKHKQQIAAFITETKRDLSEVKELPEQVIIDKISNQMVGDYGLFFYMTGYLKDGNVVNTCISNSILNGYYESIKPGMILNSQKVLVKYKAQPNEYIKMEHYGVSLRFKRNSTVEGMICDFKR